MQWSKVLPGIILLGYIFEGTGMDFLLVPVFLVISKVLLDYLPGFAYICKFIGKHSTNMWLTHTFFCYYFYYFVKIVYSTPNAYIDCAILILLALSSSLLIDLFWKWVSIIYIIAVRKITT